MGVHSVVSLPLIVGEDVLGAMNVYAYAEDAFDDRAAQLGELFAVPAAISVQNARALAQAQRLAARLKESLTARTVIDQAVGILIARSGLDAPGTLEQLRRLSRAQGGDVTVTAQRLLDEATARARAAATRRATER